MQYKIDTKENFDIITPQMSQFNYNMAEELITLCVQLQENDKSAIIHFVNIEAVDKEMIELIERLRMQFYSNNLSFALSSVAPSLKKVFSEEMNITPSLIEAIDIISMEGLERDLMSDF